MVRKPRTEFGKVDSRYQRIFEMLQDDICASLAVQQRKHRGRVENNVSHGRRLLRRLQKPPACARQ